MAASLKTGATSSSDAAGVPEDAREKGKEKLRKGETASRGGRGGNASGVRTRRKRTPQQSHIFVLTRPKTFPAEVDSAATAAAEGSDVYRSPTLGSRFGSSRNEQASSESPLVSFPLSQATLSRFPQSSLLSLCLRFHFPPSRSSSPSSSSAKSSPPLTDPSLFFLPSSFLYFPPLCLPPFLRPSLTAQKAACTLTPLANVKIDNFYIYRYSWRSQPP